MSGAPLRISSLLEHAARVFPESVITTRTVEGGLVRSDWREVRRRARQVARALDRMGLDAGDRVATLAWSTHRHLELYYGVAGSGRVIHPVNPRLHPDDLLYILNHAEDRLLLVDATFLPLVAGIRDRLESVETVILLSDPPEDSLPSAPATGGAAALDYESWIRREDPDAEGFAWAPIDESRAAAICYTSGTTGRPKGAVYSHRSTVLHAMGMSLPTGLGMGEGEVVLPVVPMYHVMAWGIPFSAALCGYDLVLPGPALDGASLTELMNDTGVTCCCGVPTVHLALLEHWKEADTGVPTLRSVVSGGAAPSRSMVEDLHERGVELVHSWGMTEISPVGTMSRLGPRDEGRSTTERRRRLLRQGRPLFGVELRHVDEEGRRCPWDGETQGELQVRGLWVISAYLGDAPGSAVDDDGWLPTGDVAVIHPDGSVRITDRRKDLIKSGGEWISSLALEDAACDHPRIARAAVIAVPHPRWGERPLLLAVPDAGSPPATEEVQAFLEGRVAHWWVPERVVFVDALPVGGTGKVQKEELRRRYGGAGGPDPVGDPS